MSKSGGFSDRLKKKSQTSNQDNFENLKKDDSEILENNDEEDFADSDESDNDSDSKSLASEESLSKDQKIEETKQNESNEKSFADRFGKKPAFSSQKAEDKKPQKKNDLGDIANVDPKKRAQADLIYLVKGIDDGRNAWYYVLVDRPKVQLFLKALNDDIIHLENYGVILYSAYGDDPPQEITDAINKEYGIR